MCAAGAVEEPVPWTLALAFGVWVSVPSCVVRFSLSPGRMHLVDDLTWIDRCVESFITLPQSM